MKTFIVLIMLTCCAQAETLFVQTRGGTISIIKDLDAKTCKITLAKIKCFSNCLCSGVDEDGNEKPHVRSECTSMTSDGDFKMGDCLK